MVKTGGGKRIRADRELDRRIAMLALPALGSIAAEPAYSLADTAIVGHLGRVPLDSLAIATTALTMTAWVAIFLTTATTSAVAGLAAGRATGRAARSAGAAYLVAAAGGTAVAVAVIVAAPWVATYSAGTVRRAGLVLAGPVGYLRARPPGSLSCACRRRETAISSGWRTPAAAADRGDRERATWRWQLFVVYGAHLGLVAAAWAPLTATRSRPRRAGSGRARLAAARRAAPVLPSTVVQASSCTEQTPVLGPRPERVTDLDPHEGRVGPVFHPFCRSQARAEGQSAQQLSYAGQLSWAGRVRSRARRICSHGAAHPANPSSHPRAGP